MKAINLTSEATEKGFEIYMHKCAACGVDNFINKDLFSLLLDGAIQLSLQNIETRPLMTNFLIPSLDLDIKTDTSIRSIGKTVLVKEINMSELNFEQLKPYLEIAGDNSSYLIIRATHTNSFEFKGFLFLKKPLNDIFTEVLEKPLWSFFSIKEIKNCVIISIHDRSVTVNFGNEPLIRIEKGDFFEASDFSNEIRAILEVSVEFNIKVDAINKKMSNERGQEFLDNINPILQKVLFNIINTIANIHHGSTLIFGVQTINEESNFLPKAIIVNIPYGKIFLHFYESIYEKGDDLVFREEGTEFPVFKEDFIDLQKAIINLSRTDGALVFNQNLEVIGAGAFIKIKSTAEGSGGARRKSAESFVNANPGTVAIVISQDGAVTLFK